MIDIHCHILPEVDDGPNSWEVCEAMCRMARADGIEHIIATPHANERYHYDREYLSHLRDELQRRVGPMPRLGLGCDFHISYDNFQEALVSPERYCINDTKYLLVELSNFSVPVQISECFTRLADKGITAIVTHPERNPILQQSPERVVEWAEQGFVVQVTASALTGAWGDRALRAARWLLERGAVHVLASDAHDAQRRKPLLSEGRAAAAEICGAEIARALVIDNPGAIVNGQPLRQSNQPRI